MQEAKQQVQQYLREGKITKENAIMALKILQVARSQGKQVSLDQVIKAKNLFKPTEVEEEPAEELIQEEAEDEAEAETEEPSEDDGDADTPPALGKKKKKKKKKKTKKKKGGSLGSRTTGKMKSPAPALSADSGEMSDKSKVTAILLCFFLGVFGVHRFYVGKVGTGIVMFLTVGGLGLWSLIDFIMIVIGKFRDKNGALLS